MGYRQRVKPDYNVIEEYISDKAKVLDLGCGDGTLLSLLTEKKQITGMGVDIFPDGIDECLAKGLPALQLDLNKGLARFKDSSFDFVVLNMTLQSIYDPLSLVKDMVRVGDKAVVGFPNFGHWRLLARLVIKERMPKTKTLPYEWYNTPNIRLVTVKDFRILCRENGIKIIKETFLNENGQKIAGPFINWRAIEGVFLLEKQA